MLIILKNKYKNLFTNYLNLLNTKPNVFIFIHLCVRIVILSSFMFLHERATTDMVENIAWGQEWKWGYLKHPPLFAWISEIWFVLFRYSIFFYLTSMHFFTSLAIYLSYLFYSKITTKSNAVIFAILLDLIVFYSLDFRGLNGNLICAILLPLVYYCYYKSFIEEGTFFNFFIFGFVMGLSFLGKYQNLLHLGLLGLYSLFNKNTRKLALSYKGLLAYGVFIFVILGHIIWLFKNDFITFYYISTKFNIENEGPGILTAVRFLLSIFVYALPFFMVVFLLKKKQIKNEESAENIKKEDKIFLYFNYLTYLIFWVIYNLFVGMSGDGWLISGYFLMVILLLTFLKIKVKINYFKFILIFLYILYFLSSFFRNIFWFDFKQVAAKRGIIKWKEVFKEDLKYANNYLFSTLRKYNNNKKIYIIITHKEILKTNKEDLEKHGYISINHCNANSVNELSQMKDIFQQPIYRTIIKEDRKWKLFLTKLFNKKEECYVVNFFKKR